MCSMQNNNLEALREELEKQLEWRFNELAYFKNISVQNKVSHIETYSKALLLILYSHFEGYIKFSLLCYIDYINKLNLSCKEINYTLAALALSSEFNAYDTLDKKGKFFTKKMPEEKELKRLSRRIDFLEQLENFNNKKAIIGDLVIDTKSNLNYTNLQILLYKVGLSEKLFSTYENDINQLVNLRNQIAHGEKILTFAYDKFESLENTIKKIMEEITKQIFAAAKNNDFLKSTLSRQPN